MNIPALHPSSGRGLSRRAVALIASLSMLAIFGAQSQADETITVRQRVFGHENVDPSTGAVDPSKVILSWFGVTNFAAAIGGNVVLLDAWIPRGEYSGYVPMSIPELVALDPSHIFLGHGHFDHAADAAEIAVASGAMVMGTAEHCDQIVTQAAPDPVDCTGVVDRDAAFGTRVNFAEVLPGVPGTVVKHVHSAAEPADPDDEGGAHLPTAPTPDANAVIRHLPAPEDTVNLASHLGDAEGWSILWQFQVGDFTLLWNDSSGPLKEQAPEVFDVLRGLPDTDVQVGAIMGFNQLTNGLRDPRMYIEAIGPKIFVPSHHDNWAPGVSTRGENYKPYVEEELARIPEAERPILRFISDPQDYVRPEVLTFDIESAYWD